MRRLYRPNLPPDDDKILARLALTYVPASPDPVIPERYGSMKREQEKLPSYPPGSNPDADRRVLRDKERDALWDRYLRHCSSLGSAVVTLLLGERDDVPAALKDLAKLAGKAIRSREKYMKNRGW